jgi:hypothetical protein
MNEELQYYQDRLAELWPDKAEEEIKKAAFKMAMQRWVKHKDEWVMRDAIAAGLSQKEFFNLMVKKSELPTEPDFTAHQEGAIANFKKYPYNFRLVGSMEVTEEVQNMAFFENIKQGSTIKNKRPNDYILMKSVLCTSLPFVNANGDAFRAEDMVEAVESGQLDKFQPAIVDWGHDFQVYGTTIGAEIRDIELNIDGIGKNNVKQIVVYSVFHAWRFPQHAGKIRKWADKKVLGFSMACGAEKATWLNGNSVRVLEKPHYVANSIIPPDGDPADDNARLLEIAQKNDSIPVVYSTYSDVPDNLTCAFYKPENNKPEHNTGDDMDNAEKINALEVEIAKLKKENDELKKTETAKKIGELESELAILKTEKENHDAIVAELNDKVKAAEDAQKIAEESLTTANATIKDLRSGEVERINTERKETIAKIVGEEEEKVNFWLEKYKASVGEDGSIVDPKEEFEQAMNAMPKVEKKVETETEVETETKTENLEDVESSDKVDRSKENPPVATASSKDEKKLFPNSIA